MKIGAVIPAAGQGKRMKSNINKQYLKLNDRPLLAHTIDIFSKNDNIDQIIVVVRKTEIDYCKKHVLDKYGFERVKIVAGGETRQQSVYAGLMAFSPAINYVIIHDGARPLLSEKVLDKVIDNLDNHNALTTGVPVKDTIKRVGQNTYVNQTLEREKLISVQTPQAFSYDLICRAHESYDDSIKVTDDASLVEAIEQKVKVIEGEYENIKITTPSDLLYAEAILKKDK